MGFVIVRRCRLAGSLALQGLSLTSAAASYLWNAAPYILTLVIMVIFSSRAPEPWSGAPSPNWV